MEIAPPVDLKTKKRPWLAWTLVALGAVERIVGWGGSIDFLLARWKEPAWVATILMAVLAYANLVGLALLIGGIVLLIVHERKRNDTLYGPMKKQWDDAPNFVALLEGGIEALPSLPIGGDTAMAMGTVRDPTTEEILERGLYVGQILADDSRLEEDHVLMLTVRGFNGANRIIRISEIAGHVSADSEDESGMPQRKSLPTPTLIRNSSESESIGKLSEFHISLQQHLTPSQTTGALGALEKDWLRLDLDCLDIRVASINEPGVQVRLPLWSGINISRRTGLQVGRGYKLKIEKSLISQSSINEPVEE